MKIRTIVIITTEREVDPEEYEFIGAAAFLEMDKRHVERNPACLLDIPDVKIKVDVKRVENTFLTKVDHEISSASLSSPYFA